MGTHVNFGRALRSNNRPELHTVLIASAVEPNKLAVLAVVGVIILAAACSFAGAAPAARVVRHRSNRVSVGDVENK
jgi:hypothetical protein